MFLYFGPLILIEMKETLTKGRQGRIQDFGKGGVRITVKH